MIRRQHAPVLLLALVVLAPLEAQMEPVPEDSGVVGLGLALRRLGTTGSVLFVTAHPDDERNSVLAYLSRGLGLRVGILTLTRGAGGQNEIGPELGDALSVLRSEELLAVHRHDRVEQLFGQVVDFGYSFSVEETLEQWGHEQTLEDIVAVIRRFRPDVVVTMRPDGAGGGQHHQTSARLAQEAFADAADPDRFPSQLAAGLRPWKAERLFMSPFRLAPDEQTRALRLPVDEFDPLLGKTYAHYGALIRNLHRCQGMNSPPSLAGGEASWLAVVPERLPGNASAVSLTRPSLDRTLVVLAAADGVSAAVRDAVRGVAQEASLAASAFREGKLATVPDHVTSGLAKLRTARSLLEEPGNARGDLAFLLEKEEDDWVEACAVAWRIGATSLVVSSEDPAAGSVDGVVAPGEVFEVETTVVTHLAVPDLEKRFRVRGVELRLPVGWTSRILVAGDSSPAAGEGTSWRHRVRVGEDVQPRSPFWRRPDLFSGRYESSAHPGELGEFGLATPFPPPAVIAEIACELDGVRLSIRRPVIHRFYGASSGRHRSHALKVVRGLSLRPRARQVVLPRRDGLLALELEVVVRNDFPRETTAVVQPELPPGWRSDPERVEARFAGENVEEVLSFRLFPPEGVPAGRHEVRFTARAEGRSCRDGYTPIAYHHIQTRHLYKPSVVQVVVFDVAIADGLRIGYVMGVGDEVPEALVALGAEVALLGPDDLARGDLGRFDTIVTGVRAYKDRTDLLRYNARLLDWVRHGGHLVVQYNKYEFLRSDYAPYPATIHRPHDRVTDESAPPVLLEPGHAFFHWPNEIGPPDWQGWVQERGLYFLGEWDQQFRPLVEFTDPFPYNPHAKRGGLVVCRHGDGTYVYTGLAFFRQLPAGVPGAYRLLANLVSAGARDVEKRQ